MDSSLFINSNGSKKFAYIVVSTLRKCISLKIAFSSGWSFVRYWDLVPEKSKYLRVCALTHVFCEDRSDRWRDSNGII